MDAIPPPADRITNVQGILVGHAHDTGTVTGCSVVLCPGGAVVGVDVRGSAPATRETDLCRPGTLVERADAILLAGGSAFGLAAATGVMQFLHEQGRGFETGIVPVPIVPAAGLFDLAIGEPGWPDEAMGYEACRSASAGNVLQGSVGAGTGATVGKIMGLACATKSGIGSTSRQVGSVTVGALIAVNAVGDVVSPRTDEIVAGARDPATGEFVDTRRRLLTGMTAQAERMNTTIGVIATDAALTVEQVNHLATIGHDGLARVIQPVHTMFDGDCLFALSTGTATAERVPMALLEVAVVDVVMRAVLRSVAHATELGGVGPSALARQLVI